MIRCSFTGFNLFALTFGFIAIKRNYTRVGEGFPPPPHHWQMYGRIFDGTMPTIGYAVSGGDADDCVCVLLSVNRFIEHAEIKCNNTRRHGIRRMFRCVRSFVRVQH